MKTLYSSTFFSIILAFLIFMGVKEQPIMLVQGGDKPVFKSSIESIGPAPSPYENATLNIEIFDTFGCPECDQFALNTVKTLQEKYEKDPKVNFHLYLIPDPANEGEVKAVVGAQCGAKFSHFWDMYYELHKVSELTSREIDLTGQGLELPIVPFRNCLKSDEFNETIEKDRAYATAKDITRKPTILINNTMLLGNQPIENIEKVINRINDLRFKIQN